MLITKCTKVAGRSSIYELTDKFFFFFLIIIDRQPDIKSKTALIKFELQTSCWPPRHSERSTQLQKRMLAKKKKKNLVTLCIHLRHLAKTFYKIYFGNMCKRVLVPFMLTKQQLDNHQFRIIRLMSKTCRQELQGNYTRHQILNLYLNSLHCARSRLPEL